VRGDSFQDGCNLIVKELLLINGVAHLEVPRSRVGYSAGLESSPPQHHTLCHNLSPMRGICSSDPPASKGDRMSGMEWGDDENEKFVLGRRPQTE